jgi:hypothetical protein
MNTKQMWNDGPEFQHFLTDPDCPVRNPNVCFGGGGGGSAPSPPDYSQYISAMTKIGNTLTGYGGDLYKWATDQGVNLGNLANTVSTRAGAMADSAAGQGQDLMSNWEKTYGPIYQSQAQNTEQFIKDLPSTQEQWAGKYAADAGQAFDASAAAQKRKLQGYGLSAPSVGTGAIDAATANQRALATTAASEQGRVAARSYGDQITGQTLNAGQNVAQVGSSQQNTGLAAGNQQINAPESAASTTAGLYAPSISYYGTAQPYMSAWGNTMSNAYNQSLAQYKGNQESSSGWGSLAGSLLGAAGTVAGAYFGGPAGAAAGSTIGSSIGKNIATGGMIRAEDGGAINTGMSYVGAGSVVPAAASPTRGAETDDVHVGVHHEGTPTGEKAAINVGEFIWPKDVVQWRGEQWMQKEIQKARKERQQQTVAEPEMAPPQMAAMNTAPPTPAPHGAFA